MKKHPDFIIIGAMKCATSTLHTQLARQPGFFMTEPKEPYFFSDDPVFAKGFEWYDRLYEGAGPGDLTGESSTHYTKLPTYPKTVERIAARVPDARFIYVMRHPIDRLVSQYIHQWTTREIRVPIDEAIDKHGELIAYSKYAMQLTPYIQVFGHERICPMFFERLTTQPEAELKRACAFLGRDGDPEWHEEEAKQNISAEKLRLTPLQRELLLDNPVLTRIRHAVVPKGLREWVKGRMRMQERPQLSPGSIAKLESIFDEELATLGAWLGMDLRCQTFKETARAQAPAWTPAVEAVRDGGPNLNFSGAPAT